MAAQTFRRSKIEKLLETYEGHLFFAQKELEHLTDETLRSYKEGQINILGQIVRDIKRDFSFGD